MVAGIYGWVIEPSTDPDAGPRPRRRSRTPRSTAPDDAAETDADGARRRAEPRRLRSLTDIAAATSTTNRRAPPAATGAARLPTHDHRHLQREAGDVGVPRLGVPAVRRADLDVPALQERRPTVRPTPHDLYDIPFTSVSSFVLLMSSLTMVLARRRHQRGDHQRMRTWLLATALLGAIFISGQVYEFTAFVKEGMGFTTNPASSAFYTLTGFHGVHVTIGIIMLMSLVVLSLRGRLPEDRPRSSRSSACTGTSSTSCGS